MARVCYAICAAERLRCRGDRDGAEARRVREAAMPQSERLFIIRDEPRERNLVARYAATAQRVTDSRERRS